MAAAVTFYGLAVELAQLLMPAFGRSFEWKDFVADAIGVLTGWMLLRLFVATQEAPAAETSV